MCVKTRQGNPKILLSCAIDKGAPAATQVADRLYLVQNLAEILEKILSSYGVELKAVEQQQASASTSDRFAKRLIGSKFTRSLQTVTFRVVECRDPTTKSIDDLTLQQRGYIGCEHTLTLYLSTSQYDDNPNPLLSLSRESNPQPLLHKLLPKISTIELSIAK